MSQIGVYQQPEWSGREEALRLLADGGDEAPRAVIALALYDDDFLFLNHLLLKLIQSTHPVDVHNCAVIGLGHIARRFGRSPTPDAISHLAELLQKDTPLRGVAHTALEDVDRFSPDRLPGEVFALLDRGPTPESSLDGYLNAVSPDEPRLLKLTTSESRAIGDDIRSRFMVGSPRGWWRAMPNILRRWPHPTGELSEVVLAAAGTTRGDWVFMPDNDDGSDLPAYRGSLNLIERALDGAQCAYPAFYVFARPATFVVAYTHRSEFRIVAPIR